MKIGAYQFPVSGDIKHNLEVIRKAAASAACEGVKLLAFPECALTGYPPHDVKNSASVDFHALEAAYDLLQNIATQNSISIIAGTITRERHKFYNSVLLFTPQDKKLVYQKRALWGWDRENFSTGNLGGVFEIGGFSLGVRICYEVRFPEFFRELYAEETDLNIILFYDISDCDDTDRYELIRSHIRTRAVENVTDTLSINVSSSYQTAPTGLYDKSGRILKELKRGEEDLLIWDFENTPLDFGEQGRKEISDCLTF